MTAFCRHVRIRGSSGDCNRRRVCLSRYLRACVVRQDGRHTRGGYDPRNSGRRSSRTPRSPLRRCRMRWCARRRPTRHSRIPSGPYGPAVQHCADQPLQGIRRCRDSRV